MATGFGTDSHCYDAIRTGRLVSGLELLAQAIYRRLTTPRGTLDDGDEGLVYGLDLFDFVGTLGTDEAVAAIPDVIAAEVLKDDRIERVEVSASVERSSDGLVTVIVDIDAFPADQSQPFTLTLAVSDVTVELIGVSVS